MYCPECGAELQETAKFCDKCGTDQRKTAENTQMQTQTTITLEPVSPVRKPAAVKLISIIVAVAAVLCIGAAGFIFLPKILSGSKPKADNCLAVSLDAIENMAELSSFEYEIAVNDGYEAFGMGGFLSLGKDLYSSVFEMTIDQEQTKGRALFYGGFFGVYSHSTYDDWDDYESYEYIDVKSILDEIFDMASGMGVDVGEIGIDINNFVKDGRFNFDEFNKINEKMSHNASDYIGDLDDFGIEGDFDISGYLDKLPELSKELNKIFENFLYVACEKEAFLGEFVSDIDIKKEGSSTTYNYTVSLTKLAKTLTQYMIDNVPKYPELSALLEDIAASRKMTLDELLSFISYTMRNALEDTSDGNDFFEFDEIKFSVTVSKDRLLEKFAISFDVTIYDWEYDGITGEYTSTEKLSTVLFEITLSEHNKVKADMAEIESFMKKAKENAYN